MIIVGLILSFISLIFAVFVSKSELKEAGVDNLIFHNSLTYVVIGGYVFLIGYLLQPIPQILESTVMDIGLIIGLFIILIYLWNFLRIKLGILDVDMNIDFSKGSNKEKIPQFLITSLILSTIFSLLCILFKMIYLLAGYAITCIIFIIIIAAFMFTILFTLYYIQKRKSK